MSIIDTNNKKLHEEDFIFIKNQALIDYRKDTKLSGSDIILALLFISPILGKTKLQKEVFLAWKEILIKKTEDPVFFPHKYGAYSKVVDDSLNRLERDKMIEKKGKSKYMISQKGTKYIVDRLNKFDVELEKLKMKKIDWDEWTDDGILAYVYRKYPEYAINTRLRSKKWLSK